MYNYKYFILFYLSSPILAAHPEKTNSIKQLIQAGRNLRSEGNIKGALACFEKIASLEPNNVLAYHELGLTFNVAGQVDRAIKMFEQFLSLHPYHPTALYNKAYTLKISNHIDQAIINYTKAIEQDPHYTRAHLGLCYAHLAKGNFKDGWRHYQNYLKLEKIDKDTKQFRELIKKNIDLAGKTVILQDNHGIGDAIQYIRYATLLKKRGATVICQVRQQLIPLFSSSDNIDILISKSDPLPDHTAKASIFDMPYIFDTELQTIPSHINYLSVDQRYMKKWQESFAGKDTLKIGICWQAENLVSWHPLTKRSIPLKAFYPLANNPHIRLYSLQKIVGLEQLNLQPEDFKLHVFDSFDEEDGAFIDTAAIMKQLDLVITIDTSIAHLAGTLGVSTYVLLPFSAEHRWLLKRSDCPWYPTMRLFRQSEPGNWDNVLHKIMHRLAEDYPKQFNNTHKKS